MTKRGRFLVLILWLIFFANSIVVAQTEPPPPYMATTTTQDSTVPCSEGNDGTGTGVTPPPGLCLPINDYLLPLFLAGLALGSFYLIKIEKKDSL